MNELLVQQLEESTLDEVFTLLEPHLKQTKVQGREMAVQTLRTTLKTFMVNYDFAGGLRDSDGGDASSFKPAPYIIGSLVPR